MVEHHSPLVVSLLISIFDNGSRSFLSFGQDCFLHFFDSFFDTASNHQDIPNIISPTIQIMNFYLIISLLIISLKATGNPGILISVPFPILIPTIPLSLPLSIDNIVVSNLELTNIFLQEFNYNWNFDISNVSVQISHAKISFNWTYKADVGVGTFSEDNLEMVFKLSFKSSSSNHFLIDVTQTKIKAGHSKVVLGGKIPETVAVEVTNLILNHASILFRSFIGKELTKTIAGLGSSIGDDKLIYTDSETKTQFFLNTSLVSSPLIAGSSLIVQLNGATYPKGKVTGNLDPQDILIKTNSSKIQVHIHKKVVSQFIGQLMKTKGGDFAITVHSGSISSIIDVNSLLLSPIFPPMAQFSDERDVIFDLKISNIVSSFDINNLRFELTMFANVYTYNTIQKREQLYIDRIDGKMLLQIVPIFGKIRNSIKIDKLSVLQFTPQQKDIDQNRIVPEKATSYFGFLTNWMNDAINIGLNRKVVSFTKSNILAVLTGNVIKDHDYCLEIEIKEKQI